MVKVRSEYTSVRDCINLPDTPENAPTFGCGLYACFDSIPQLSMCKALWKVSMNKTKNQTSGRVHSLKGRLRFMHMTCIGRPREVMLWGYTGGALGSWRGTRASWEAS